MKLYKTEYWLWGTFAAYGILFLIIGACVCIPRFSYAGKEETAAYITKIQDHKTYVSYTVEGETYTSRLNGYSSSFYPGKEIEIYYDREDPERIGARMFDLLFLIFPGIGAVFFLIGGTGMLVLLGRKKRDQNLKETGRRVYGAYQKTAQNLLYTVNRRHPYYIVCQWRDPEDGKTYLFRSGNLWMDPEPLIQARNITVFPVYFDPRNKKRYVVDTEAVTRYAVDDT